MAKISIALQLYSVRKNCEQDFPIECARHCLENLKKITGG